MTERDRVAPLSTFELAAELVRRRAWLIGVPFVTALITSGVVLVVPHTYAAGGSFVAETESMAGVPASFAGLATQLGINIGSEPSRSPDFYADLLRSRRLLEPLLSRHVVNAEGEDVTVLSLYEVVAPTPERLIEEGIKELRRRVTVSVDRRTNIVRYQVEAPTPASALAMAEMLFAEMTSFNAVSRQSSARLKREFLEERVEQSLSELRAAEADLEAFYERNRVYEAAPLRLEEQRLVRQVGVQQEVYTTLRRTFETTRVEEVDDTPVLTVIEAPTLPGLRLRPRRTVTVLALTFVAAALTAMVIVAAALHRHWVASSAPGYVDFLASMRRAGPGRTRD